MSTTSRIIPLLLFVVMSATLQTGEANADEPPTQDRADEKKVLVKKGRQLNIERGSCGNGIERGASYILQYADVGDGKLNFLYQAETYSAEYVSPYPPDTEIFTEVELTGGIPRTIIETKETKCYEWYDDPEEIEELKQDGTLESCTPLKKVTRYHYRDGKYLAE